MNISSFNLVLFKLGNKLESTGKSWCPDCTAAEPLIETALEDLPSGYTFLEVPVVREEYKKPDFVLRTHAQVKLRCVPTLFKWSAAGPGESLDDSQCMDKKVVLKFFGSA